MPEYRVSDEVLAELARDAGMALVGVLDGNKPVFERRTVPLHERYANILRENKRLTVINEEYGKRIGALSKVDALAAAEAKWKASEKAPQRQPEGTLRVPGENPDEDAAAELLNWNPDPEPEQESDPLAPSEAIKRAIEQRRVAPPPPSFAMPPQLADEILRSLRKL